MTSLLKISVGFWGKHEDAPPDALSMRKLLTKCRVQSADGCCYPIGICSGAKITSPVSSD